MNYQPRGRREEEEETGNKKQQNLNLNKKYICIYYQKE